MRYGVNLALLTCFFMISTFCVIPDVRAADPVELENLRGSFHTLKYKLINDYITELNALERSMFSTNNESGAEAVRQEKDRMVKELPTVAVAPPPVAPPPPKPEVKKRDPKTHVSSVEGFAGAPSFSRNNIYTFNLGDVGKTSTLTYWATGHRSTNSIGNVWLITPDGQREKVSKWKDRYLEKPATEISSYKKLQPISGDISKLVTGPGIYQIEFEWTGGVDPLVVFRVELTS